MSRSEAEKHELDAAELRSLIARDLEASNDLATRITQLRQDISEGKPLPPKKIDIMERSNKDMTKDLMLRIEKMEGAEGLTAIDREMLQALNARLAVCDMQTMRLAELRDLETAARGEKMREFLEVDAEAEAQVPLSPKQEFEAMPVDEDAANLEAHETDQGSSVGRHDNSSDNSDADDTDDSEPDESSWPLLYRIMGVDPSTCPEDIASALSKARKTLAAKHSPQHRPNDPSAHARWEAITKAHDVLADPEKRRFYDAHGRTPSRLEEFDLSQLDLD